MGAFGSTPNASGATISAGSLVLQPADATRPGHIAASGTQTLGVTLNAVNISGTNTGDDTLAAAIGSAPNAAGATLSAHLITLQPADGTNPGLLTAGAQHIGGAKTFDTSMIVSGSISPSAGLSVSGADVTVAASNVASTINYDPDGATALAWSTDTGSAWVNAGAKIHSFKNNGVEKAYVSAAGKGVFAAGTTSGGSAVLTSADWAWTAYDPITAIGTTGTVAQMGAVTSASTLRSCNYTVGAAAVGTGTETIGLCNGAGITSGSCTGTQYATLSLTSGNTGQTVVTCTINNAAVPAAANPTWVITASTLATSDTSGNLTAKFTTP